jgi:hypothetical protein
MVIHEVALSDRRGEVPMRFDPGNTGIGTIERRNRLDQYPGIRNVVESNVRICPLDDVGLVNISFMKIDVEGHEPSVLRGAVRLLEKEKPVLLIEIERRHNPGAFEEVETLLSGLGYGGWRLCQEQLIPVHAGELEQLQKFPLQTDEEYVNNFIFVPPGRSQVLHEIQSDKVPLRKIPLHSDQRSS